MNRRQSLALPLLLLAATPAGAGKAKYRVKLLGGELRDGRWLAGLEIDMDKGWKTYWRVPGDSGIPPSFDWSGSTNVKSVEMRWPAPRRYHDDAGETIGYKRHVVFPLTVTPEDAEKPVVLALKTFFAICMDICIPVKAEARAELAADALAASLIAAFDAQVPLPGTVFKDAKVISAEGRPALLLTGADLAEGADIFVEGFESAYFRAPRRVSEGALLPIDGLKDPARLKGRKLTLTLVSDAMRLEQQVTVD